MYITLGTVRIQNRQY